MKRIVLWSLVSLFLSLTTLPAEASRKIRFTHHNVKMKPIDIKKLNVKPAKTSSYTQSWNIWSWNDKGYVVYGLVALTKIFGVMRLGVQLTVRTPDGKVKHKTAEYTGSKYNWDKGRLRVWVPNKHVFQFRGNRGLFIAQFGKWACRLRMTRVLPGFRFANGRVKFGNRTFNGVTFAPRLAVKGRLVINGQKHRFNGVGYADYGWQNIMPQHISKRWFSARSITKDYTIIGAQLLPSPKWRPRSIPILSIAYKGKYIFQADHRHLTFAARRRKFDKRSGYRVPQYTVFRGKKNGMRVKLVIKHTKMYDNFDALSRMSPMLRFVIRNLVSNPFIFRYKAKFVLTLRKGSKRTRIVRYGFTEFAILNK